MSAVAILMPIVYNGAISYALEYGGVFTGFRAPRQWWRPSPFEFYKMGQIYTIIIDVTMV